MPSPNRLSLKRSRLLVASPDRYFRLQMAEILSGYGYAQPAFADSARGVFESLDRNALGLVFLDEDMPLLTPFELARMIHSKVNSENVPLMILIAAKPTRLAVNEARQAGFDALISKPVIPVRLLRTIDQLQSVRVAA
jgi:CheY-like chemotaxis protein